MVKIKFKTLTMRIWTTFTLTILFIILSISLFYLLAYKSITEKASIADLKVSHEATLNSSDFNTQVQFSTFRNLKGSKNVLLSIYNSEAIVTMLNKNFVNPPPTNENSTNNYNDKFPVIEYNDTMLKWIKTHINSDNLDEKQFSKVFNGTKFVFYVSTVNSSKVAALNATDSANILKSDSYLITYMPVMQDYSMLYNMFIIGLVFIAIGFISAKLIANYISRPLKELEEYTRRIAKKEWKEPIEVKYYDEIGSLANSMNQMQKDLKRAEDEEKMFLQSISHDLKTPVMVIMSHADAIIDGVYVESVENTAGIIRDEAITLEKKIKQMLYLNTLDYVLDNSEDNDEIQLNKLVKSIINRFELINSKIEWDMDLKDAVIKGNADKIKVSIENIFDNGLRYAHSKMMVKLFTESGKIVLDIFNDGPKINDEHISFIFDNHYKDKTGNFGLGLAISKKIINFYKGTITAANRSNGVSFIIEFPVI